MGNMAQVEPYSGDMLPMVARLYRATLATPVAVELDELAHTPCLRSSSVTVRTRSVAVEPSGSSPVSLNPTTSGMSMVTGSPSMAASASMPADAPAEHPEPVDHGRVRVGAEERVRVSLAVVGEDDPGQVLQVDLVADAGVGRDDLQAGERLLAPAQEPVALLVALELELGVAPEGVRPAGEVGDHRVVYDELGGHLGLHGHRVAAQGHHGVAHSRQVGDHGHSGEVLHEDPGRRKGDLSRSAR